MERRLSCMSPAGWTWHWGREAIKGQSLLPPLFSSSIVLPFEKLVFHSWSWHCLLYDRPERGHRDPWCLVGSLCPYVVS